ncbi:PAS domain S-box-containing protein/diguanylate cyclase (GGDEF) domain-containing protein [Sphingomonas gellani]|uniref:PAS domain S-box-containing protein/diguanylate cyclase (GGDEF) domain-containing protein n=1 Tax=Sphingomonas gellani TaxID=1166340 RepID=A0A1H8F796_9SPHN|nr:EAL domain-containing protein [Sphingomonas gellani]SEN27771.1 PAS domain S-box-containing protein/diguanylate cyclase (GGDEF) domain-containing protein [Sphingomonas gellani]
MRIAKLLPDESERLAALDEYGVEEGEVDSGLDDVTDLAARLFGVTTALVTLVGDTRQLFAGRTGTQLCGTDRNVSFCSHALDGDDLLVVPDARLDPRFFDNPLVSGEPGIRFYAGVPLRNHAGHVLGTLCLIDPQPRAGLPARDRKALRELAALALNKLEQRRLETARRAGQRRFHNIAATSPDAIVCADDQGRITFWNATAEKLFGFTRAEAIGNGLDLIVPHHMRGGHGNGLHRVAGGGAPRLVGKTIELNAMHRDGHEFPIELSLSMWREDGHASFGAIMRDISERRRNEDKLFHLAHHDPLTGLPNRNVLFDRIAERIDQHCPAHLLFVDMDGFKPVNDTAGHGVGDAVLKQVGDRLVECVGAVDTVARIGGDEFAVLIVPSEGHGAPTDDPDHAADCIIASLGKPYAVEGQAVHLGASVGIASFPAHAHSAEELISGADLAMYQAKREGRRCRRTFNVALREQALARREREEELRRAIDGDEFELFYQPQVDLADGRLIGAEALLRWNHPERGLVGPGDFLPAIEQGLLATEIGTWILEVACSQAVAWRRILPGFRMGVNLFSAQFGTGTLAALVAAVLDRCGLDAAGLELEVTENIILRHDATMLDALRTLHDSGVGIALDDFGTGYASLSVLKTYPLTRLKIDRSFVRDMRTDHTDALIVSTIAALGNGLGLDVIAEGIEEEGQRALLQVSGCRSGQGYLFGHPMPAKDFERLIARPADDAGAEGLRA